MKKITAMLLAAALCLSVCCFAGAENSYVFKIALQNGDVFSFCGPDQREQISVPSHSQIFFPKKRS